MDSGARQDLDSLLCRLPERSAGRCGRPGDPWNLLFAAREGVNDKGYPFFTDGRVLCAAFRN